jgi:hypothetical protein
MTANQINYLKQIEEHRSNIAQETETHRANVAREAENARANTLNYQASIYSTEAGMRNADVNAETQRVVAGIHAAASIQGAAISADASRYATDTNRIINMSRITSDQTIAASNLGETRRHNVAVETETERHQTRQDRSNTWKNVISGVGTVLNAGHNVVSDVISAGSLLMNTKSRRVA